MEVPLQTLTGERSEAAIVACGGIDQEMLSALSRWFGDDDPYEKSVRVLFVRRCSVRNVIGLSCTGCIWL
jgi:hypothetical protein